MDNIIETMNIDNIVEMTELDPNTDIIAGLGIDYYKRINSVPYLLKYLILQDKGSFLRYGAIYKFLRF